jgi:hypothetical protein
MKYETTSDFVKAVQTGAFTGRVIVDNDCVNAFEGDEEVCDFEGSGPEGALIDVLAALGANAERC